LAQVVLRPSRLGSEGGNMFKADGSAIKNPRGYVASIEKNGYNYPLFTADGEEIDDPVAFLGAMGLQDDGAKGGRANGKRKQKGGASRGRAAESDHGGEAIMFKEDGSPINNPEGYVASIQKNGYNHPLFTLQGDEIRDPVKFLASKMGGSDRMHEDEPPRKRSRVDGKGGGGKGRGGGLAALPAEEGLFKADGTMIKNPVGYVAAIERNGYTNPLFTSQGKEIRDPVKYLAAAEKRTSPSSGSGALADRSSGAPGLFKADGTEIHNPAAYVASIEKNGYTSLLYTADGNEIRNPVAYLRKNMDGHTQVEAPTQSSNREKVAMFKSDGSQIKKPEAYVASIERNGYTQPLFTADGQEIRNPAKYLEIGLGMSSSAVATRPAPSRTPRTGKATRRSVQPISRKRVAPNRERNQQERSEGLYKEDGSQIKNPSRYVANFEVNGQSHPLFNARGQVVQNPAAYVAKMMENAQGQPTQKRGFAQRNRAALVPQSNAGKSSYYGKPGSGTLAQRLKTALTSGMRGRAASGAGRPGVKRR